MTRARPKQALIIAVAVAMNLAWALSYPLSKHLLTTVSPFAVAAVRMTGAGLLGAPFLRRRDFPRPVRAKDFALLFVMGVVGCALASTLQYAGTARTMASNVALVTALEPSIVTILAALTLGERVRLRQAIAVVVALAGISLLSVDPESLDLLSSRYFIGNVVVLGSVVCYASYTVAAKGLSDRWGTSALTIVPFFLAGATLVPAVGLARPGDLAKLAHLTPGEASSLVFLVVVATGIGYLVWNWLLQWLSATEVALTIYIQPIAGTILSTWLLHEPLAAPFVVGAALVMGALVLGRPPPEGRAEGVRVG